ncbi:hypothetical protein DZF91_18545 [Actinomadura logoneensis]|uniref:Tetratricopeptide repeat protein n=1 Tax=Actinomadura logoneensis TaxID=2293572 RepID=A0A372JJN5_9ACTN|nr:hypothetical protein [Actinomadura logoneensis]RFU40160.1 hypothetical protein DZF91_18545 [Actinomadura logoneensis]
MALVEAEFDEGLFLRVLALMLSEAPLPVPTFPGLPDGQLLTGIDWSAGITLDATPDGSAPPADTMAARAEGTVRHLSVAELEADPHAAEHATPAVFWLHLWVLGSGLLIDLRSVDLAGQGPRDVGHRLWRFGLDLDEARIVDGAIHHADGYVTLRLSTTGTDDLSAPPVHHLDQPPHQSNDFLVRVSGEVFADALAAQLTRQLAPPPQGTTVEEYPHAAWGNWAPGLGWRPRWGWAAVADCVLKKPDACPALFGPVDVSVEITAALSVEVRKPDTAPDPDPAHPGAPPPDVPPGTPPGTPPGAPPKAELEQTLHLSGDASDWDVFRCFLGTGGIGGLLFGIATNPVVGVIIGAVGLIALGEIVRGQVRQQVRDVDAPPFVRVGSDDGGVTYRRRTPLPDILQSLDRLEWNVDQDGLMVSITRVVLPGRHVPDFQPPPGPLTGAWGGGRYDCGTGRWHPDDRYTLAPVAIADRVFVLGQHLLDTEIEVFSAVALPAGAWTLTRTTATPQAPNPQVMVSSAGTPAEGATGRLYVHTNAGLARYELGPVPAPLPPTPERLQAERIACAKQTVRALRAQGEAGRPALAAALVALDGLLAQAGRISEAVMDMEEAVRTYRDTAAAHPDNIEYLSGLIASLYLLTARYSQAGQPARGAGRGDEAVRAAERLEAAGANEETRKNIAADLDNLAGYLPPGEEAIRVAEKATAMYRALVGPDPG